jgi:phytoene/squalene synthetase
MRQFLLGMICGAALLFVAMHYHVVRGNDGVVLVPKISNNLSDVYVDIREYQLSDWKEHKPLAAAIMKSSQAHLIEDSAHRAFGDSMRGLVDGLFTSSK